MSEGKTPIDIETLLQWTMERSIAPRLHVPGRAELLFNYGYSAIPRGFHGICGRTNVTVEGGRLALDIDAERVLAAIDRLDPFTQSLIRRNAEGKRRPDWFEGVEPVQVERRIYKKRKKGGKKQHRKTVVMVWEPVSPAAIRAQRQLYGDWHAALRRLATMLRGTLETWEIIGFDAPEQPWEATLEKAA